MKRILYLLALIAIHASAETFTWTNGTGGPTPDGTRLYCTITKPYGGAPSAQVPLAATSATFSLQADVVPLTYSCVARHYKGSVESADSNEIQVPVAAVPLPAPKNFKLSLTLTQQADGTLAVLDMKIEPE